MKFIDFLRHLFGMSLEKETSEIVEHDKVFITLGDEAVEVTNNDSEI